MIKVMLVDDSELTLIILKKMLSTATDITVVGTALNGQEALQLLPKLNPDVICSDVQMPIMDGFAFTKAVMSEFPRPILVISAVVQESDSDNIFKLMQAGAIDVMAKPCNGLSNESGLNNQELINKIRVLSGVHVMKRRTRSVQNTSPLTETIIKQSHSRPQIMAIGASTGGPQALYEILTKLPSNFPVPIICVQHISEGFSAGLVKWLNTDCKLNIQFAKSGQKPEPGHIYFAPDAKQLEFNPQHQMVCTQAPSYGGHRPSISVTFQSMALRFGAHVTAVLLTGMGRDGVDGLLTIKQMGGMTIAQDESSSVVFGMPKVAIEEQATQQVLPLTKIAQTLVDLAAPQ